MKTHNPLVFHMLGIPYTKTTEEYQVCAFTQKIFRLCKILTDLGHIVYHYGVEGSNPPGAILFNCVSDELFQETYKERNWQLTGPMEDQTLPTWIEWEKNTIDYLHAHSTPKDFLLCPLGAGHQALAQHERVKELGLIDVEPGIGYVHTFARHKVYESYAWQNFLYGKAGLMHPDAWFDTVIPAYFEPSDYIFPPRAIEERNYYSFFGRLNVDKGLQIAIDTCRALGKKLVIAGGGNLAQFNLEGLEYQYVGLVGKEDRAKILSGAIASFAPSTYVEPFGAVVLEAAFSGVPIITTDIGAFSEIVLQGRTGFRCSTFNEFKEAVLTAHTLDPDVIREWAEDNFSMKVAAIRYENYFQKLYHGYKTQSWYEREHPANFIPLERTHPI